MITSTKPPAASTTSPYVFYTAKNSITAAYELFRRYNRAILPHYKARVFARFKPLYVQLSQPLYVEEFGAGLGTFLEAVAEDPDIFPPQTRLTGLDFNRDELQAAEFRMMERGLAHRVDFRYEDLANDPPAAFGVAQIIYAKAFIEHLNLEAIGRVYQKVFARLSTGGLFFQFGLDLASAVTGHWGAEVPADPDLAADFALYQDVVGAIYAILQQVGTPSIIPDGRAAQLLAQVGFTVLEAGTGTDAAIAIPAGEDATGANYQSLLEMASMGAFPERIAGKLSGKHPGITRDIIIDWLVRLCNSPLKGRLSYDHRCVVAIKPAGKPDSRS